VDCRLKRKSISGVRESGPICRVLPPAAFFPFLYLSIFGKKLSLSLVECQGEKMVQSRRSDKPNAKPFSFTNGTHVP
jgi:hypothetical protein